jgi:hypothetical protein
MVKPRPGFGWRGSFGGTPFDGRAKSELTWYRYHLRASDRPTAKMSPGMTLFAVQAILILGTEDGSRIFTKYYSPPHAAPTGTHD